MTGGQTQLLSQDWVYNNILELFDEEIVDERRKIAEDLKRQQEQAAVTNPPMPGAEEQPQAAGQPPTSAEEQPSAEEPTSSEEEPQQNTPSQQDQEAQIDTVDRILNFLEPLDDTDEDEEELEELLIKNKGGRPREGLKFGTDKHPLGRDPLGHKENRKAYKRSTLSVETKSFLDKLPHKRVSTYKQIIADNINPDKLEG